MNDFELESKLKTVRLPARTEDYWEYFPAQVRAKLRPRRADWTPRNVWSPRLAWAAGIAYACLLLSLSVWCERHPRQNPFYSMFQNERAIRKELAQFPGHLRVFMQDEHGMHRLIADQE
jgi:hypothetical protein